MGHTALGDEPMGVSLTGPSRCCITYRLRRSVYDLGPDADPWREALQ